MYYLNKTSRLILSLCLGLLLINAKSAQSAEDNVMLEPDQENEENSIESNLTVSGFGDIIFLIGEANAFQINQVEVDLEKIIAECIEVQTAIAFDPESETFGLGAFTIDFHLFGSEGDHFRMINGIDHSGILVGLFDVPFGIDWQVYPSIERKLISAPIAVEEIHSLWNDYGILAYINNKRFNAVVFRTNGFGYEMDQQSGSQISVELEYSLGGRFGINLGSSVEAGLSDAGFFNNHNQLDMNIKGFDLQLKHRWLELKWEYMIKEFNLIEHPVFTSSGYYLDGLVNTEKFFLDTRYDHFSEEDPGSENVRRISVGLGGLVKPGLELRFEYQRDLGASENGGYMQLVESF